MNIRKSMLSWLYALLVPLLALAPLAFSSTAAQAQQSAYQVSIDGFDVEQVRQLSAGNGLVFTLYGSAGGTATVRIDGVVDRFPLQEVESGVYEGTYTISSHDRIAADSLVTANLRVGNRIATAILDESLLAGAASRSEIKRAADAAALAATPRIDRFEADRAPNLNSGTDLFFSLTGSPGAKASVRIQGVRGKVFLQEVTAGVYEGAYTIKNRDRIQPTSAVTATLAQGKKAVSAALGQSLLAATGRVSPAQRAARVCANCGTVESIDMVEVKGDGGYLGKIAGGVVGAMIGSQVGQGRGTTAAEIAGAVGGAVAGNEIEKRTRKTRHYDVTVRLQSGGTQVISYAAEPALRVGDKVRVENGTLVPNP